MLTATSFPTSPPPTFSSLSPTNDQFTFFPFEVVLIYLKKNHHASVSPFFSSTQLSSSKELQTSFLHFQSRATLCMSQDQLVPEMDAFYEPSASPWIIASRHKADMTIFFASVRRLSRNILNSLTAWFYGTLFIASIHEPMPSNILEKWYRRSIRQMRGFVFPSHPVPFHPLPLPLIQLLRPKLIAFSTRLQAWMSMLLVDGKLALASKEWFSVTDLERSLMLSMAWRFLSHPYFDHPIFLSDSAPNSMYRLIGVQLSPNLFSLSLVQSDSKIQEEAVRGQIVPLLWSDVPGNLSEPVHTKLDFNLLCLLLYFEKQGHWIFPTLPRATSQIETETLVLHLATWLQLMQYEKDVARPYMDELVTQPLFVLEQSPKVKEFRGYWKYFPEVRAHVWFLCTLDLPDYALSRVATDCLIYFLNEVLM